MSVMKHSQNSADISNLMKETANNRHAWIRTSKAIVGDILERYPHLLLPNIVEQDFEMTISKEASKRLIVTWPRMAKLLLEYVTKVESPKHWQEKIGLTTDMDNLSEDEQQAVAFNLLPFLFSGRSKTMRGRCTPEQALYTFIEWKAEGTSVEFFCKNVVNTENQQSQPFVLLIGGSRWNPLQSFAIIEHRAVACPSILSAIDTVFKLIYVLDLNYQPQCMAVWQFLESLVYKLGNSVTVASILRFRNWMSQQ